MWRVASAGPYNMVARQNEVRQKRAPAKGAEDDEQPGANTSIYRPPSFAVKKFQEEKQAMSAEEEALTPAERGERRAAARDAEKPWRSHMKPATSGDAHAKRDGADKASRTDAPAAATGGGAAGAAPAADGGGKAGLKALLEQDAAEAEEAKTKFEAEEAKKAEVREFIVQSREKWKKKLAMEKALLTAASELRTRTRQEAEARAREQAKAAAAEAKLRAKAPPPQAWVDATEISPAKSEGLLETRNGFPAAAPIELQQLEVAGTPGSRRPGSRIPLPPSFQSRSAAASAAHKPDWEQPKAVTPLPSPAPGPRSPAAPAATRAPAAEAEAAAPNGRRAAWVMPALEMPVMPVVLDFQDFVQKKGAAHRGHGGHGGGGEAGPGHSSTSHLNVSRLWSPNPPKSRSF